MEFRNTIATGHDSEKRQKHYWFICCKDNNCSPIQSRNLINTPEQSKPGAQLELSDNDDPSRICIDKQENVEKEQSSPQIGTQQTNGSQKIEIEKQECSPSPIKKEECVAEIVNSDIEM